MHALLQLSTYDLSRTMRPRRGARIERPAPRFNAPVNPLPPEWLLTEANEREAPRSPRAAAARDTGIGGVPGPLPPA